MAEAKVRSGVDGPVLVDLLGSMTTSATNVVGTPPTAKGSAESHSNTRRATPGVAILADRWSRSFDLGRIWPDGGGSDGLDI
jgi:hypothetical protein